MDNNENKNKNNLNNDNKNNNNNNFKINLKLNYLFFMCWKNKWIKNNIIKHLRLFSYHYSQVLIKNRQDIVDFNNYPYKSYIRSLKLHFNNSEQRPILLEILRNLPQFVECVEFDAFRYFYNNDEDGSSDEELYILNEILEVLNCLPPTIKVIHASSIFNSPLPLNCLPPKIETFIMSNSFNLPLYKIPAITTSKTITTLILGNKKYGKFNQTIPPNVLPESLTILDTGSEFNQELFENSLPPNLLHLTFGNRFNKLLGINVLPKKLKSIHFGDCFNKPLKTGVLPPFIQVVEFSPFCEFNQNLELGTFPSSIHTLKFGVYFQKSICENGITFLPSKLKNLIFNNKESSSSEVRHFFHSYYCFISTNTPIIEKGSLPQIEYLQVGSNQTINEGSIPSSVTSINGCKLEDLKKMPHSITEFTFDFYFNEKLTCLSTNQIPFNIKRLIFSNDYNQELNESISDLINLEYLEFGHNFNKSIDINLPKNLKTIVFGHKFNQIIKCLLPESLENILFGHSFNQIIVSKTTLPKNNNDNIQSTIISNNLKSLKFGNNYSIPLYQSLFKDFTNLKQLEFGVSFNETINIDNLPPNIETLIIRGSPLIELPLPHSLNTIYFCNKNYNNSFLNRNIKQIPILINILKVLGENNNINTENNIFLNKLKE